MGVAVYEFKGNFSDMGLTLDCGQAFRWHVGGNSASGIISSKKGNSIVLAAWASEDLAIAVDSDKTELNQKFWEEYFGISQETEWEKLYRKIWELKEEIGPEATVACTKAIEYSPTMAILKQDPWECLISFIISQRNSIPRIMRIVEELSQELGEELKLGERKGYAFPSAEKLAALTEEELKDFGLGYRARYIKEAAEWCLRNPNWDEELNKRSTESLKTELKKLNGVGDKVASCIALFGFGRHEEFPIDVWIQRVLDKYFGGENPASKFGELAGLLQQSLFIAVRAGLI